jgi:hypothetical protein
MGSEAAMEVKWLSREREVAFVGNSQMETDSLEHWPKRLKIFCGYVMISFQVTILQPHMTLQTSSH